MWPVGVLCGAARCHLGGVAMGLCAAASTTSVCDLTERSKPHLWPQAITQGNSLIIHTVNT